MAIINKIIFKNYSCGELCPTNTLELELNSRCDYVDIEEQLYLQGWQIYSINNKRVYGLCQCGDAIFYDKGKYCHKCLDNHEKGGESAVSWKRSK